MPALPAALLPVALIFVVAGTVKGVTGMGLPTVAMGLLGLLMAPAEAAALIIVPSLVTNLWQAIAGGDPRAILRRLAPMLLAIAVATWAAAGLLAGGGAGAAGVALGLALMIYALVGLAKVRVAVGRRREPWLSPLIGAATGLVTGATGVFVIPAVPYLQALGFEKDALVQALGLSFTASTLALAAGLATRGGFHLSAAGTSLLCTAPALLGLLIGQWVRGKVDPQAFRLIFLIGLLLLGADLAARPLL